MKKLFTKRVSSLLMVLAMTAALLLPVSASTSKTLKVTAGTPLYLNGLLANTTDISGKTNQLFYSDGTTYAPVRAIAEALGQNVTWNSKTHAVEIGTEGNDAANDAAYLQEYFKIAPMSGTVSWTTYTAALNKLGVKDVGGLRHADPGRRRQERGGAGQHDRAGRHLYRRRGQGRHRALRRDFRRGRALRRLRAPDEPDSRHREVHRAADRRARPPSC
jgi:hypothetical protein